MKKNTYFKLELLRYCLFFVLCRIQAAYPFQDKSIRWISKHIKAIGSIAIAIDVISIDEIAIDVIAIDVMAINKKSNR